MFGFGAGVAWGGSEFLTYFIFLAVLLFLVTLLAKSKKIENIITSFENYLKNKGINSITVGAISYVLVLISYTFAVLLAISPILLFS